LLIVIVMLQYSLCVILPCVVTGETYLSPPFWYGRCSRAF